MDYAIETDHLTKLFEKPRGWRRVVRANATTAVNDVSLQVRQGELFGLLGPNGAGKTTLVKMLCTLISPTGGTAMVAGHPLTAPGAIRAEVGLVVTDERSFYWRLTAWHNLKFFAAMYGLRGRAAEQRIEEVLRAVDMLEAAHRPFSGYSTGMRQRVAIARGLLHQPHILFLDEPSRSLDPMATENLHELILNLIAGQGVTIFLITHDLVEAEKLCDQVAVMHKGRIRTVGRPASLRQRLQRQLRYIIRTDAIPAAVAGGLRGIAPDLSLEPAPGASQLAFQAGEADGKLTAVLDCLRHHNLTIYSVQGEPPTMEEVFRHYTRDERPLSAGTEGETAVATGPVKEGRA